MVAMRTVLLVALVACGRVDSNAPSSNPDAPSPDSNAAACPGLFCSSFEPGEPLWDPTRDPGAVVEVVSQGEITPHSGTHALHVLLAAMPSNGGTASSQAAMYHSFTGSPYTSGELYARAWFQVPASNTGIVKNHVDLFSLGKAGHGGEEIALYLPGQQPDGPDGQVLAWVDPTGSPDGVTLSPPSPFVIPTGSWFCLALHVTIGQNGPLEFGLNQAQSGSLATQTLLNDGTDQIGVGVEFLDQTKSTGISELYVDDVAVGTSPLTCP